MRRVLVVLAGIAATCGAAEAQTQTFPEQTYPIPLPPTSEPRWEVGARYWQSVGETRFSINSSNVNPIYGNPTSVLVYEGMDGYSGEFFWNVRNETDTFFKGYIGGGGLSGGSLDDEDYFAGQIKFSDTYSRIEGSDLVYGTFDVGQRFMLLDAATKISLSPFIGLNFWQETARAFGARCNADDVGGAACGPPGFMAVPFSTEVIENEANWTTLRIGGEIKLKVYDRLTLMAEAAVLPVAHVWNNDSHLLRADLGPVPNIRDRGTGWGYQLEASMRYDFTPNWSAGAGVRYWYAQVDGESEFVNFGIEVPLEDFTSERFGVYGEVAYRFSTF